MKNKIYFFLLCIFTLFPCFTRADLNTNYLPLEVKLVSEVNYKISEYTYERVFKDGIWWIYVYDGSELIDIYPE